MEQLELKENGSYTECIQSVSKLYTQDRLGKVSIGKDRLELKKNNIESSNIKEEEIEQTDKFILDAIADGYELVERKKEGRNE